MQPIRMGRRPWTVIVFLIGGLLVSACGVSKPADTAGKGGTGEGVKAGTGSAIQASVDELRIAIPGEGDTLDPAHFSLVTSFSVATNIYSALVRYKPGTIEPEPDLAERWDVSPDGKSWTFHLRKGVKWQKGYGELTAQDVVDSYQRILDPNTASRWKGELSVIDKIEAPDPLTVLFRLKEPSAAFLHTVVAFRQGLITKKEAVDKFGQDSGRNPVGTGAFELEKWVPGTEVVLKANPDFYLGKPQVSRVRFVVIADETVRMLALEKGEVDIAMSLTNPEIRKRLAAKSGIDLGEVASPTMHGVRVNTRLKPLDNPKVRQALYMGIDRESIATVILGGLASPAYSELAPPFLGHNPNVPKYEYNPTMAKQLLAQAGYPNGFETSLVWLNTINKEILDTLTANWKAIGVTLKANSVDGGTWVQLTGQGESPLSWFAATRSDPHIFYKTFLHSSAFPPGLNASWYGEADAMIDEGGREMDAGKRKDIYGKIQERVMTDLPLFPIYWPKHSHPYAKYVEGWGGRQNYDAWAFPISMKK